MNIAENDFVAGFVEAARWLAGVIHARGQLSMGDAPLAPKATAVEAEQQSRAEEKKVF